MAELFQPGQTSTTSLADPFRGNASSTVFQITQGNLALDPEKADTLGIGVILQPRLLPGFAISADYYDVRIDDAISTVNAPTLVNQCFLDNTEFCSQITRNSSGVISSVVVLPVNLAEQNSRGLDLETSYRRTLLAGNLTVRALATRFLENESDDGITPPVDSVGTNGLNGSLRNSLPKWRYLATASWDRDPIALSFTVRGFSDGVYNTTYVECSAACPTSSAAHMTINDNHVPGAIYFDANFTLTFSEQAEAFLGIDNIANKAPEQVAYGPSVGQAPISINPLLYDVLGRNFRVGVRFKL